MVLRSGRRLAPGIPIQWESCHPCSWPTRPPATPSPTGSCACSRPSPPRGPCRPRPRSDGARGSPARARIGSWASWSTQGCSSATTTAASASACGCGSWPPARRRRCGCARPRCRRWSGCRPGCGSTRSSAILEQDEALFLERLSGPASGSNVTRIAGQAPAARVVVGTRAARVRRPRSAGARARGAARAAHRGDDHRPDSAPPQARRGPRTRARGRAGLHRRRSRRAWPSRCATRPARRRRTVRRSAPRRRRSNSPSSSFTRRNRDIERSLGFRGESTFPFNGIARREDRRDGESSHSGLPDPAGPASRRRRRHDNHHPHPCRHRRRRSRRPAALAPAGAVRASSRSWSTAHRANEIESTIRAGILEQGTVEADTLGEFRGARTVGTRHDGIELRFAGARSPHRLSRRSSAAACGCTRSTKR